MIMLKIRSPYSLLSRIYCYVCIVLFCRRNNRPITMSSQSIFHAFVFVPGSVTTSVPGPTYPVENPQELIPPLALVPAPSEPGEEEDLFWWPPPPAHQWALTKEEIDHRRAARAFLRRYPAEGARRFGFRLIRDRIRSGWYNR